MKKANYNELHLRIVQAAERIDMTLNEIRITADYKEHVNLFNKLTLLLMRCHNLIDTLCIHDKIPEGLQKETSELLRDILSFNKGY